MPNKFNIETWQYIFIQTSAATPSLTPCFPHSRQLSSLLPQPQQPSHSPFNLLLALRADIIILECLCVDKLTKRNSFLSCCSSLASSSPWTSVFFIVVGIVIIFYAKSNKVNKNIAKKHIHTKQRWKKRETARRFGLVESCLLVCYAGNLVAIKECLRFIDFILVHNNTHTCFHPTHMQQHTRIHRSSPVHKFYT